MLTFKTCDCGYKAGAEHAKGKPIKQQRKILNKKNIEV